MSPAVEVGGRYDHVIDGRVIRQVYVVTMDEEPAGTALVQALHGPIRGTRYYVALDALRGRP